MPLMGNEPCCPRCGEPMDIEWAERHQADCWRDGDITLAQFVKTFGVKYMAIETPGVPLPPNLHPRMGYKPYGITMRLAGDPSRVLQMPFFATERPYAERVLESLAEDARYFEDTAPDALPEDANGEYTLAEHAEIWVACRAQASLLRNFLGEEAYQVLLRQTTPLE